MLISAKGLKYFWYSLYWSWITQYIHPRIRYYGNDANESL